MCVMFCSLAPNAPLLKITDLMFDWEDEFAWIGMDWKDDAHQAFSSFALVNAQRPCGLQELVHISHAAGRQCKHLFSLCQLLVLLD